MSRSLSADHSVVLVEEARIDSHVLLHPLAYLNPEPELLEPIAQSVAVDQLDRGGTVPGCLRLGVVGDPGGSASPGPGVGARRVWWIA